MENNEKKKKKLIYYPFVELLSCRGFDVCTIGLMAKVGVFLGDGSVGGTWLGRYIMYYINESSSPVPSKFAIVQLSSSSKYSSNETKKNDHITLLFGE